MPRGALLSRLLEGLDEERWRQVESSADPEFDPDRPVFVDGDDEWNEMERALHGGG